MRHTILIAIFTLFFISCKKDKFTTAPQLTFKKVNTQNLSGGGTLTFTLSFTDKQGDLDSLFCKEINPTCTASVVRDSTVLPAIDPTKKVEGEILYSLIQGSDILGPQCNKNDTCHFQFYVKDKMGNKSDTVNSPTIVILY